MRAYAHARTNVQTRAHAHKDTLMQTLTYTLTHSH